MYYEYAGRFFATLTAAEAYRRTREWIASKRKSNRKNSALTERLNKSANKFKFKEDRSWTMTKTKEEDDPMQEDSIQGVKKDLVKIYTGLKPLRRMTHNNILYRDEFEGKIAWTGNSSIFQIPWYVGTTSQFLTSTTNATAVNRDQVSYGAFFNLNPLQGIAGGVLVPSTTNPLQDIMGIKSSTVYMDFLNASSLPIFLKIHYFMCKQDGDVDVLSTYSGGLTNENLYSTDYAFPGTEIRPLNSGDENAEYTAATTSTPTQLKVLPYTNLLSKRNTSSQWKKLKTKTYSMAAGDTMRVTTLCTNNQFGIKERLNSQPCIFPKGTVCMVLEVQGTAAVVATSGIIGAPTTYSGGALSWVATRKVNLSVMKAPNQRFNTTYVGAGTVYSNTAVTNSAVIGENTLVQDAGNAIFVP